ELAVRLEALVAERQKLRGRSASARALERNRPQIPRAQGELSHLLIDRYLPAASISDHTPGPQSPTSTRIALPATATRTTSVSPRCFARNGARWRPTILAGGHQSGSVSTSDAGVPGSERRKRGTIPVSRSPRRTGRNGCGSIEAPARAAIDSAAE